MSTMSALCTVAMVVRITSFTDSRPLRIVGLEELEDSDEDGYDDDAEALVEPLRQSGVQAEVGKTIRRLKPGVMAPYEEQVRS